MAKIIARRPPIGPRSLPGTSVATPIEREYSPAPPIPWKTRSTILQGVSSASVFVKMVWIILCSQLCHGLSQPTAQGEDGEDQQRDKIGTAAAEDITPSREYDKKSFSKHKMVSKFALRRCDRIAANTYQYMSTDMMQQSSSTGRSPLARTRWKSKLSPLWSFRALTAADRRIVQ